MKATSFLLMIVLLGALALVFSSVHAQPPHPAFGEIADELGLTDEQMESIKEIQLNFKKTEIGLKADLKTSRLELRHLLMQEKPSQKEISKLVEKIGETQKRLLKNNVDRKMAMKEILTREQFKKFTRMKERWPKEKMGQKFGPPHPHGFCPHGDKPGF